MRPPVPPTVPPPADATLHPAFAPILLLVLSSLLVQLGFLAMPALQRWLNPVFAALLFGLAAGLLLSSHRHGRAWLQALPLRPLGLWQQRSLRLGIVLFAANVTPDAILSMAPVQVLQLILLVASVLALAWWLGTRLFRLPAELVLLVSAGLSFCGTSAIFATQSMRQSSHAHLTQSLAVVMLMGLAALGSYTLMIQQQWLTPTALAWFIGSTAPEVAQAVAAGSQLADAAPQAIIAKLSRVCLLLPFLLWLGQRPQQSNQAAVNFPWFIVAFVAMLALQLLLPLPRWLLESASYLSQGCLIFAMLANGVQTKAQDLRQCNLKLFGFAAVVMLLLFGLALGLLQL